MQKISNARNLQAWELSSDPLFPEEVQLYYFQRGTNFRDFFILEDFWFFLVF